MMWTSLCRAGSKKVRVPVGADWAATALALANPRRLAAELAARLRGVPGLETLLVAAVPSSAPGRVKSWKCFCQNVGKCCKMLAKNIQK